MSTFYERPLVPTRGSGNILTDASGESYLDFYSAVSANILGYDVPEIWEAVREQLRSGIVHLSPFYVSRRRVELAERLAELSGIPDAVVSFTVSGSEAVDLALFLATLYRRSSHVLALRHGFHGTTFGAMAVTGDRRWVGMGLSPFQVGYARGGYDRHHGPSAGLDDAAYVRACAQDLAELIGAGTADRVAALIVEPVQGVAGAAPLAPGLLEAYRPILQREGILLISDEVQTGWGRTGGHLWGYQHHDVVPDLLVFGKGLGGGFPIGGVVARREIMEAMTGMRVSATSGDPLPVAAALATLDHVQAHDLPANAGRLGSLLLDGLRERIFDTAIVADVRGRGLLLAIEFTGPDRDSAGSEIAVRVQEGCRRNGVLVGLGGAEEHCLSLMPPLTLTEAQAREGMEAIASAVREADRGIAADRGGKAE
ncbi:MULTISPECIES: aspartate aminotransferase family protein [Actinomadura]|nr:aminotransferase class III-fold pyridoxal phosphate-dependent enzyme [Actinomadura sp. J1-007]